jgi:hypothetical protein
MKSSKIISTIIPIKEELNTLKKIKKEYTPDFIYMFAKNEWRFTANDGEYNVAIKISSGFVVIAVHETEYEFFTKDGTLIGFVDKGIELNTQEVMAFFGWDDIEDVCACE